MAATLLRAVRERNNLERTLAATIAWLSHMPQVALVGFVLLLLTPTVLFIFII
jgi:hypothetical protein